MNKIYGKDYTSGSVYAQYGILGSLDDWPSKITGTFNCSQNDLTSLVGCPQHITGTFECTSNLFSNLNGGPQKVEGDYICSHNLLTSLIGCASYIGGELNLQSMTELRSLVGIHKIIKSCKEINFDANRIIHGGIGLLLIYNLSLIRDDGYTLPPPFSIIEQYIGTGTKGMMECSKELIEKGYEDYAKL